MLFYLKFTRKVKLFDFFLILVRNTEVSVVVTPDQRAASFLWIWNSIHHPHSMINPQRDYSLHFLVKTREKIAMSFEPCTSWVQSHVKYAHSFYLIYSFSSLFLKRWLSDSFAKLVFKPIIMLFLEITPMNLSNLKFVKIWTNIKDNIRSNQTSQ